MVIFHSYVSLPEGMSTVCELEHGPVEMSWIYRFRLPSGYVKIAMEKSPFIVSFPIKNGDFP